MTKKNEVDADKFDVSFRNLLNTCLEVIEHSSASTFSLKGDSEESKIHKELIRYQKAYDGTEPHDHYPLFFELLKSKRSPILRGRSLVWLDENVEIQYLKDDPEMFKKNIKIRLTEIYKLAKAISANVKSKTDEANRRFDKTPLMFIAETFLINLYSTFRDSSPRSADIVSLNKNIEEISRTSGIKVASSSGGSFGGMMETITSTLSGLGLNMPTDGSFNPQEMLGNILKQDGLTELMGNVMKDTPKDAAMPDIISAVMKQLGSGNFGEMIQNLQKAGPSVTEPEGDKLAIEDKTE